jgi:acyl-coenzyme A thioesterase PaaI-like protein
MLRSRGQSDSPSRTVLSTPERSASVADSACGYAAFTLAPAATDVLAVEFKINLLAPARATTFEARARVVRSGRTLSTCFAEVFGVQNGDEELVATMMSTIITRPNR